MTGWTKPSAWVNSAEADAVAKYYSDGHSVKETAERFGVSTGQVNNLARSRSLTNGRSLAAGSAECNDARKKEAEENLQARLGKMGFLYCGGYSGKSGSVEIGCKTCGERFTRTVDFIRRGNPTCPSCAKAEKEEAQNQKRLLAEQERERKRQEKKLLPKIDYYSKAHEDFLNRVGVCCICGRSYTVREYVESAGLKYATDNGVCSIECKREKARRIKRSHKTPSNHRRRAMIHGVGYEKGITLKKLVMRDGLRCALCGELCDWNDHTWSKYSGPKHPTIDHIVPIAKGGSHTWENVQVACAMCNSLKGDSILADCVKGGA